MNRVFTIITQLNIYGDYIRDQTVVEKVLRYLSTNFDFLVETIEEAKDLTSLIVD